MKNFQPKLVAAAMMVTFFVSSASHAQTATLLDVYQMAKQQDAKMAQALAQFDSDKKILELVKAPLRPQVSLQGTLSKNDSSIDTSDFTSGNVSLVVNQALFYQEAWAVEEQAEFQYRTAEATLKNAEQDLILRVAEKYFNVLLAEEDVQLALAQESANKSQWERSQTSSEVGLSDKTDVLQSKSTYDISVSDRINAENSLDVALEELSKLTGKRVLKIKAIPQTFEIRKTDYKLAEWEQRAQQDNLQVQILSQQAFISSKEIEVEQAAYTPTVNLQASYGVTNYYDPENSNVFQDKNDLSVSLIASVDLYSGGATSINVSQARDDYKAATMGLRDAKEQARLSARVLVRSIEKGYELVSALRAAVQSSDAFLDAAQESHKEGLKSLLEVLSARTSSYQAKRNLASAIQSLFMNKLKLEAEVGALTVEDIMVFTQLFSAPEPQQSKLIKE